MNLQRAVWLYRPATSDSISSFELTALNCSLHNQSWLTIVTSVCQKNENKWEVANVLVLFTELISVSCKIQINSFVVRCWPACCRGAYLRAPEDTLVGARRCSLFPSLDLGLHVRHGRWGPGVLPLLDRGRLRGRAPRRSWRDPRAPCRCAWAAPEVFPCMPWNT